MTIPQANLLDRLESVLGKRYLGFAKEVIVSIEWPAERVEVEHGYYGCDSGCEYTRIYVTRQGDHGDDEVELFGSFGFEEDRELHAEAWAIADALGVPAVLRDWTRDGVRELPRPGGGDA